MSDWYVLFAKTGQEETIVSNLLSRMDEHYYTPFVPTREIFYRRKGVTSRYRSLLYPGYIFLQSEHSQDKFMNDILPIINTTNGIYRFLDYGCKSNLTMHEYEKQQLEFLIGPDKCIEFSVGIIIDDQVRIIQGPLKGKESTIRKINRHNCEAVIDVSLMGDIRPVRVGLEIIKKL